MTESAILPDETLLPYDDAAIPHLGILTTLLGFALIGYLLGKTHHTALWRGIAAGVTPLLLLLFAMTGFSPSLFLKVLLA